MASSSGGMVLNTNYPELKRPRNFNFEEFTTVDGQRQKNECKFLLISHQDDTKDLNKVSPFVIQKGLDNIVKNLKNIKKIRSGQLLVETKFSSQIDKLLKATVLFESIPITVQLHPHLNSTKGIVYAPDLIDVPEQTICDELRDQKVTEVKRIRRLPNAKDGTVTKDSEGFVPTPLLIVTFNVTTLPKKLKAAYLMLNVEPYVPNPMRCKHCQLFGHTKNRCKVITGNCAKCSLKYDEQHLEGVLCKNPSLCANCHGPHEAFRKCCRRFKEEYAISKIKTVERVTYHEAKQKYIALNPVNHMISVAEMVRITSSHTSPASAEDLNTTSTNKNLPTNQPTPKSSPCSSPQRKISPPKPIPQAKNQIQQKKNTEIQAQSNHRGQKTPTTSPERISDERREELLNLLQDRIQERKQNENKQQKPSQKPSKPNPFAFPLTLPKSTAQVLPLSSTAAQISVDMISDGEESSSSTSSFSSVKKKTKNQTQKQNKNINNMDIN